MPTSLRNLTLGGLAALLIAALIGFALTRQDSSRRLRQIANKSMPEPAKLVEEAPLQTAHNLADIASTAEEQKLAAEAVHVADHEVDMAFASALQHAEIHPPAETAATKEINDRIRAMESRLQQVQAQSATLTKLATNPSKNDAHAVQQQLELAQARIALLQDALADAQEDLTRAGGDPQAEIKQELEQHEALQHGASAATPSKPASFVVEGDLLSQFRTWQRLRNNQARLLEAKQQAETYAATLAGKHQAMEKGMTATLDTDAGVPSDDSGAMGMAAADTSPHAAKMANLHSLSQNSKMLAEYDKRIQAEQQLKALYGQWNDILTDQRRQALHAMVRSLLFIVLALIGLVLAEGLIERFYIKLGPDRRRLGTMRLLLRFVSQCIGVLIILLVLFGPPSQLATVVALAATGLTVALKDFIVAFFGWFVLMGRHGIRVGDWVEINGIGGEVVEVGLLRTILLETGNWNDAGHPTGRKVSCVNSFAVEGQYFNFTTAGQWLWDELDILIPASEDPYYLTNSVLKLVNEQTQADAALAEEEWRRVTQRSAIQTFSAAPAINVRPTNLGVNLVVRYVVNAHSRYDVRTRLYQAIVEMLHASKLGQSTEQALPAKPGAPSER